MCWTRQSFLLPLLIASCFIVIAIAITIADPVYGIDDEEKQQQFTSFSSKKGRNIVDLGASSSSSFSVPPLSSSHHDRHRHRHRHRPPSIELAIQNVEEYLNSIGFTLHDLHHHHHFQNHPLFHDEEKTVEELKLKLNSNFLRKASTTAAQRRRSLEDVQQQKQQQDEESNNNNGNSNRNRNSNSNRKNEHEEFNPTDTKSMIQNAIMAFICVSVAALAAGLTMGLLGLDVLDLRIKEMASSNLQERKYATTLLPLVKDHHRLLVTLLLMNALANEALPLFLDELVPSYVAVIMSVTLVLFFGEIIPSAIFTGPNQLAISSKLAPLVRLVLFLLAPLAVPIAKALDYFLHDGGGGDSSGHGNGHGGDRDHGHDSGALQKYDRNELSALVRLQFEHRMVTKAMQKDARKKNLGQVLVRDESELYLTSTTATDTATNTTTNTQRYTIVSPTNEESDRGSEMTTSNRFVKHIDEVNMVEGALSMHTKKVIDVMQPWKNVFTIPNDMILNEKNIVEIYRSGHSRIPVYNVNTTETAQDDDDDDDDDGFDVTQHICGLFKTKHLVVINSNDKRVVSSLELAKPFFVEPSMNMVDLLNLLQEAKGKMAIVCLNATEGRMALNKNLPIPPSAQVIGIVTLEDCLEELIQEEIYDEYDKEEMVAFKRAKWAVEKWKGFVKKRKSMRIEEDVVVDETSSLLHPGSVE